MTDEIYGYSTEVISEFVGSKSGEYIERFRSLKTKRKFNSAAAFFGGFWFGYRKIWSEGIGILFFCMLIRFILFTFQTIYLFIKSDPGLVHISYTVYRCTAYAVQLTIFGFTADKLYWRNIKKRIDFSHLPDEVRGKKPGVITACKECRGVSVEKGIAMLILAWGLKRTEEFCMSILIRVIAMFF